MRIFLTLVFILTVSCLAAQDYQKLVGLRSGSMQGAELKMFIGEDEALHGVIGFNRSGVKMMCFKEKHQPFMWKLNNRIFAYWGYGSHIGYFRYDYYDRFLVLVPDPVPAHRMKHYPVIGLDGIMGIEYRFLKYPFVVAMECNPNFDLFGPDFFNFHFGDGAVSFRYIFSR